MTQDIQGRPANKKGIQDPIPYWWTNVGAEVWLRVGRVLAWGKERYGDWDGSNHRAIPYEDHINHARTHLEESGLPNPEEDHLAHVVCRALFAMETQGEGEVEAARAAEERKWEKWQQGQAPRLNEAYPLRCNRCGAPHWLDTSLPSDLWNQIASPNEVLCVLCIDDALAEKGLTGEAKFYFVGKALRGSDYG